MRRRWLLLIESYSGELFARNDLTAEREEALVLSSRALRLPHKWAFALPLIVFVIAN